MYNLAQLLSHNVAQNYGSDLYNVIAYFTGINLVHGYTTTIFSIWFVGGMTIFVLGIVGLYIGKIFDEVKNRQLFIIDETINLEK